MNIGRFPFATRLILVVSVIALCGCEKLTPHDTKSLLIPHLQRSEVFGFLAGLGTTCAGLPDLITMLKRRSAAGMNPRMAAITGTLQLLWCYYGLLILSRPVVGWNIIGFLINMLTVFAYRRFSRRA